MFGFPIPDSVTPVCYWGARAIYVCANYRIKGSKDAIDLLGDRQTWKGDDEQAKADLLRWINKFGLPELRKWVATKCNGSSSRQLFTYHSGPYYLLASPNASYGYVYIGAFPVATSLDMEALVKYIADWKET